MMIRRLKKWTTKIVIFRIYFLQIRQEPQNYGLKIFKCTQILYYSYQASSYIYKCMSEDNKGVERRPWTQAEDQSLKLLYQSLKLNRWSLIAQQLQIQFGFTGRTSKQCRQRYNNQLDPGLTHENWSFEQQKRLYDLHDQLGNKWAIISQRLGPGRTDNSVKNHFYSRLRKSLRKINKLIQERYKKQTREIQTKVLYKIIQASEQKFKIEPMCDLQTSQQATVLKNKILLFSHEEEELHQYGNSEKVHQLISEIIAFNKNYKRKPKKFRKLGAPNLDMLDKIDTEHQALRCHSENGSSNFLIPTRSHLDESEDQVQVARPLIQKQKMISPIIITNHAKTVENDKEKQDRSYKGSQILQELGLLEDDAGNQILLKKKETSQISNTAQQSQEQFKFFEDSEQQMRVVCGPLFGAFKKESFQQRLFQ